jgi:hypothetical protein
MVQDGGLVNFSGEGWVIRHKDNGTIKGNSVIRAGTIISEDNAAWILPGLFPGDMQQIRLTRIHA